MKRYIDASQIRYCWMYDDDGTEHDGVTLQSIINRVPTADVVEVVRCKDCRYYNGDTSVCRIMVWKMRPTSFCSYGERREE